MNESITYENISQYYQFLIDEFEFEKIDEKYYPKAFGNFYVALSSPGFLLQYTCDRSYVTIQISADIYPLKWYNLSFVKNYIYQPEKINSADDGDNVKRIELLNNFIIQDFDLITDLFSKENYPDTKKKIDDALKMEFLRCFPGSIQE